MGDEGTPGGTKPNRGIAVVLGLVGPMGVGQCYLGQTKRAAWWFGLYSVGLVFLTFAFAPLGAILGYGKTLALVVLGFVVAWAASLVDVARISEARAMRSRWVTVVVFWLIGVALSFGLRTVIRGHALEAFKIPSGSMQPTLLVDEHIMVDKGELRRRLPKRGQAIVFTFPGQPETDFIKRVVAVPGDTLELKHGHPWLNGWEVPHCLVGEATLAYARPGCSGTVELEFLDAEAYLIFLDACSDSGKQGPYRVAAGEVWVLGDNRNNSLDSPSWFGGRGGGLPVANIKGLGLFRWYSPGDWSRYGTPLAAPLLPQSMQSLRPEFEKCLASRPAREKTQPPKPE